MKFKKPAILLAVFAALMAVLAVEPHLAAILKSESGQQSDSYTSSEQQRDFGRVKALSKARDLKGLVKLANEIELRWSYDTTAYSYMMIEICSSLASYDFKNDRQYILTHKYAKLALQRADQMPVENEVRLVQYLGGDIEYFTGQVNLEEWPQDRRERMQYWFHAWRRLNSEIDRNFNVNEPPLLNVPPAGPYPSGIAPDGIKDPQLRARYEAAVQANKQKIERFNRQQLLHKLDEGFKKNLRRFIVGAYSKPPVDLAELTYYLNTYTTDDQLRQSILDEFNLTKLGNR